MNENYQFIKFKIKNKNCLEYGSYSKQFFRNYSFFLFFLK